MTQYRIELGRIVKSALFMFIVTGMILFAYSQGFFPPTTMITKPEANGSYGMKPSNDPLLMMPEAAESLFAQFTANEFITYPNGFYKVVKLNREERERMAEIVTELSINEVAGSSDFQFNPEMTWERFKELMAQADQLLGGGSDFSETWMSHRFGQIPVTYEEALKDYELIVSYDKFTGAYARLFSDYMGIILGLLPVFPAVLLCLSDRKNLSPML